MKSLLKKFVLRSVPHVGGPVVEIAKPSYPPDFSNEEIEIIEFVKPFTMTSPERLYGLIQAVRYIVNNKIEGDVVECGVWKGGSMMAIIKTLLSLHDASRDLYLFDTFEGMNEPTDKDIEYTGKSAKELLNNSNKEDESSVWCFAPLDSVMENINKLGYNKQKIHYVKGKVEDTLPKNCPNKISLLRLDTDWYESTKHELVHLYPRLVEGGVLIIDDYGHWKGSRQATDEFIQENKHKILLNRLDNTGRIAIKI
jgi:hypothetical protein